MEVFAIPAVGAIIEKAIGNKRYVLIQTRNKNENSKEHGLLEIPAGKVREYENVFEALRREVLEETGLKLTKIFGEEERKESFVNECKTISYQPFCCTQNLSGEHSIILQTFICHAEGDLLEKTNETSNIHWELISNVENMLENNPEKFYQMHINGLKKYIELF